MINALEKFKEEVEKRIEALSETPTREELETIEIFTSILAGLHHLKMMENNENQTEQVHVELYTAWKDDIDDELKSAEEKYKQYQRSGDRIMLEMSRQELEHAHYYINQAKMKNDAELRDKLPEYEQKYQELAMKINNNHGAEKLPYL